MKVRLVLLMALWVMITLACSLSGDDESREPTARPSLPTADLTIVAQANQTSTALVSRTTTPFATVTLSSGTGNTGTGNNTNPNCTPRSDWPVMVVAFGDTLGVIANLTNTTVDALVQANCLLDPDSIFAGQQLRVPVVPVQPTGIVPTGCTTAFFFTFASGKSDTSGLCPLVVVSVAAVGQDFEGGRVYRYAAPSGASDPRGTIYIIYNTGYWETVIDTWDPSQPLNDPSLVPPTGRYQPTGPIGKVWRENPQVRQALGWAYAPEAGFTGRIQTMPANAGISYFYIDHGKGIILRLYSVNNGPNTWELVGNY